jgi:hypothetical protein
MLKELLQNFHHTVLTFCCCYCFLSFPLLFSIFNFVFIIFLSLFTPFIFSTFLCYNPLFLPQTIFMPLFIHSVLLTSPPPCLPICVMHYPSCLCTYYLLISLLYQTHTPPSLCNPWHKHPPLQQINYTLTHKRALKSYKPPPILPHNWSPFCPSF